MPYIDSYRAHLEARSRRARFARILLRRAVRFAQARLRPRRAGFRTKACADARLAVVERILAGGEMR